MHEKKPIILLIMLIIIGCISYFAYHHYFYSDSSFIEASGTIEAQSVELSARISGTLMNITVKEGVLVEKGELIAELSRNDLLAQREQYAFGVVAQEANLDNLISGARTEEIKVASSAVSIAAANLQQSESELERATNLFEAGALTKADLEKLQLARDNMEQQLEAAQANLNLLQAGSRPGVIAAASAELERSKAALKGVDAQLADLQIYSPIDGIISSSNYEAGEYIQVGSSLAQVTNLQNMWIKVYIPTDDLPLITIGQKASITVSGSNQVFTGTVEYLASQGEFTPKTIQTKKERTNVVYAVKLALDNEAGLLKPGMPADVIFDRGDSDA